MGFSGRGSGQVRSTGVALGSGVAVFVGRVVDVARGVAVGRAVAVAVGLGVWLGVAVAVAGGAVGVPVGSLIIAAGTAAMVGDPLAPAPGRDHHIIKATGKNTRRKKAKNCGRRMCIVWTNRKSESFGQANQSQPASKALIVYHPCIAVKRPKRRSASVAQAYTGQRLGVGHCGPAYAINVPTRPGTPRTTDNRQRTRPMGSTPCLSTTSRT